jgi:spore coat polysaccharide biosynthesis predicted glycosyltransferase SpsG
MPQAGGLRVLFAVAAGPRIGFGHLVRCRSLARALGIPPVVAIRGTATTRRRASSTGWHVVNPMHGRTQRASAPDVVVVDDPSAAAARAWVRWARARGVPVATVHDLGIGASTADLVIDGTIAPVRAGMGRFGTLRGPEYMMLDPGIRALRGRRRGRRGFALQRRRTAPVVLIALGGGRTTALASRLARDMAGRAGGADIQVVAGFVPPARLPRLPRGRWIAATGGLVRALATATVAIVAGGVTLYEACALGVPTVALALNAAQHVTVRGVSRRGATIDGGIAGERGVLRSQSVATAVERLLADAPARRRLAAAGRRLVDGRGVFRVAARIRLLPEMVAAGISDVA